MKKLIKKLLRRSSEFSSKEYWETRYSNSGTSGSGSYGQLAIFKAEILNEFVEENNIEQVLELGCGDGNQLSIARYPKYYGIDVSSEAVKLCRNKFQDRDNYEFELLSNVDWDILHSRIQPELVMSLDVLFHLVENEVYNEYMSNLFRFDNAIVVIYSSDGNFEVSAPHIRNHKFTDWINENAPDWELVKKIPNEYPWDEKDPDSTSFSDFYFFQKRGG